MFRPSRRASVIAASFALGFASVAPSAHADRGGGHDDGDEQSGDLLDLVDITDVLGGVGLPALGQLPTVEGIGLPALEGIGLPTLESVGLPALGGIGLPPLGGIGLPGLDGLPPVGLPIPSTGPGLDLTVLVRVSLSGAITVL